MGCTATTCACTCSARPRCERLIEEFAYSNSTTMNLVAANPTPATSRSRAWLAGAAARNRRPHGRDMGKLFIWIAFFVVLACLVVVGWVIFLSANANASESPEIAGITMLLWIPLPPADWDADGTVEYISAYLIYENGVLCWRRRAVWARAAPPAAAMVNPYATTDPACWLSLGEWAAFNVARKTTKGA